MIRGLVRADGVAVANLRVVAYPAEDGIIGDAITDTAGRFEIAALSEGAYELRAMTAMRDGSARVTVQGDELAVLELAPVHAVELRVTANGARVHDFAFTCAYGSVTYSSGAGALHRGRLESRTRAPITCQVETRAGTATASGTFGTTPILELPLAAGARITGRVLDATGAASHQTVAYRDQHGFLHFAELDALGRFELVHLVPGRGELRALDNEAHPIAITVDGDRDLGTLTIPTGTSRTP